MYSCECGYVEFSHRWQHAAYAGDLISEKFMLDANIVDMVVGNFAEILRPYVQLFRFVRNRR